VRQGPPDCRLSGSQHPDQDDGRRPDAAYAVGGLFHPTIVPQTEWRQIPQTWPVSAKVCLQCGAVARSATATFCGRCGLPYGEAPRADAELPTCHICYQTVGDDGLLPSQDRLGSRVDLQVHLAEHDRHPVGDEDFLESLREGDQIRIGRWKAPFDIVRRYLVTGAVEAGRRRTFEHNTIVTAMTQIRKWGVDAEIFGDQAEWKASREAVAALMERYHRA
jgi:hypothetical protein